MIRRMFLIVEYLGKQTLAAIKAQHYDRGLLEIEETMNRLCNSCHRLINKGRVRNEKPSYLYVILWSLEGIADEYKYILQYLLGNKTFCLDKELVHLFESIINISERYTKCFYHYNLDDVEEVREELTSLRDRMISVRQSLKTQIWLYMYNIINRYYESLNSIIGYHS